MGCASSKDIDEVERKKGKKGGDKPFDRPGINYIDENPANKQPIDDKITPRDAELDEGKGQDANGVQKAPVVEETQVAATTGQEQCAAGELHIEEEGDTVKVTATTDKGEVHVSQVKPPVEEESDQPLTVTATTEEGEVEISQDIPKPETDDTPADCEQDSRTDQLVDTSENQDSNVLTVSEDHVVPVAVQTARGSIVPQDLPLAGEQKNVSELDENAKQDAINEFAEQLAEEVQKDSIRQLEREAAEGSSVDSPLVTVTEEEIQPEGLPEPPEPEPLEGSGVDAIEQGTLHVVSSEGKIIPQEVEESEVSPAPADEQDAPSFNAPEGADQSQAQEAPIEDTPLVDDQPVATQESQVDPAPLVDIAPIASEVQPEIPSSNEPEPLAPEPAQEGGN